MSLVELAKRARTIVDRRDRARVEAAAAIMRIEDRLVDALGGTTLRGMPELCDGLRAVRVHGTRDRSLDIGDRAFVLCEDGRLRFVSRTVVRVVSMPAGALELRVEDLPAVAERAAECLRDHLARSAPSAARVAEITMLARRIEAALRPI